MEYILSCLLAFYPFDVRQNRITDRLKCLRQKYLTNEARRVPRSERYHSSPQTLWHGNWHQVADKIHYILEVVLKSYACASVRAYFLTIFSRQSNRSTNSRVVVKIFRQWNADNAGIQIGLDQFTRFIADGSNFCVRPHITRCMRPSCLRKILYDLG